MQEPKIAFSPLPFSLSDGARSAKFEHSRLSATDDRDFADVQQRSSLSHLNGFEAVIYDYEMICMQLKEGGPLSCFSCEGFVGSTVVKYVDYY